MIDNMKIFVEFTKFGIDRFDLGILRASGFQQMGMSGLDLNAVRKRIGWLRHENAQGSDIYFRPFRTGSWPIVFLDDLTREQSLAVNRKYKSWVIKTSKGRFHVWILAERALSEVERKFIQSTIVRKGWGDPGSVSGDHFGRVPGFRNWKRGGEWVNLIDCPDSFGRLLSSPVGGRVLHPKASETQGPAPAVIAGRERIPGLGTESKSESEKEFGWVCGWLRRGLNEEEAIRKLTERATGRGKRQPEVYAKRTVESAKRVFGGPRL